MSGNRYMIQDQGGLTRNSRAGDSMLETVVPQIVATDANTTLTVAQMAAGAVVYTGFSAGRNITTDTATNITAAFPTMDIGDTFMVKLAVTPAFAGTYVAGAGVTLKGRSTLLASGAANVYITKTGANTYDFVAF